MAAGNTRTRLLVQSLVPALLPGDLGRAAPAPAATSGQWERRERQLQEEVSQDLRRHVLYHKRQILVSLFSALSFYFVSTFFC